MEKLVSVSIANEIDREKAYTAETFRQAAMKKPEHFNAVKELMESDGYEKRRRAFEEESEKLAAEDEKAKRLSAMQLDYLFAECDVVCFHAEQGIRLGDEEDERFAEIMNDVYRTEETENYGMNVMRIYLKPTQTLKDYLSSFKRFDRYHFDAYERFEPYTSFADILFLKDGESVLSCLTHEGYFEVADSAKSVFDAFEEETGRSL